MTQPSLENIKAIAFDLDGTLVDSAGGLAEALDNALKNKVFHQQERACFNLGR